MKAADTGAEQKPKMRLILQRGIITRRAVATSQSSITCSWRGKGHPPGRRDWGILTGVPWESQTPLDSRPAFGVLRSEELSHDKPRIWVATERAHVALPREVMPCAVIYTQPHVTEQTLLKVLTDIHLWGKSEHNRRVNSSEG